MSARRERESQMGLAELLRRVFGVTTPGAQPKETDVAADPGLAGTRAGGEYVGASGPDEGDTRRSGAERRAD